MIHEYIVLRSKYDQLFDNYMDVVKIAGQLMAENKELKRMLDMDSMICLT